MQHLLTILMIFFFQASIAQPVRYKFAIRYGDYNPLKNALILINNNRLSTDKDGNVELDIPNDRIYARIESPDPSKYRVKYPANMQVILPKNNSVIIDVYVESPSASTPPKLASKNEVLQLQKQVERFQQSGDAKVMLAIETANSRLYDSITVLFNEKSVNEARLSQGRLQFFPPISQALHTYLNEARDVKDAFGVLAISLTKKEAYEQYSDAIYSYNAIFELLNSNKSTYEQAIATYWRSKELSIKFSNLIEYMLEEIHKPYILEINQVFLPRLYEFTQEGNGKKRKALEDTLRPDILKHSDALDRRLASMGERISAFITQLNNIDTVDH
jgi:hypothetical protein